MTDRPRITIEIPHAKEALLASNFEKDEAKLRIGNPREGRERRREGKWEGQKIWKIYKSTKKQNK